MDNLTFNISGINPELAGRMQELLEEKRGQGTAISVAIVRGGEVIAAAAAGSCDGNPDHPATVNDMYNVGSIAKIYCTVAVLKLCEMGKVDLDTPVCEYLPRFVMADPRYKKITLRMCLNHSTGLPGSIWNCCFADRPQDPKAYWESFFSYLSKAVLNSEPGAYSVYCNDGFDLAAAVVATVSGMPYGAFLRETITAPFGCPSTCTGDHYEDEDAHIRFRGYVQYLNVPGAGGISTNLIDCAKFGWEFVEPGRLISAESAAQTMQPQKLARDSRDNNAMQFGLGWDDVDFRGIGIDLGEGTLFKGGATGAFSSALIVSRKHQISAAISMTGDIFQSPAKVLCDLLALIPEIHTVSEPPRQAVRPIPEEMQTACAGIYYSSMGRYQVSFQNDRLTIKKWADGNWQDMVKDIPFDGEVFYDKQVIFSFLENEDFTFLRNSAHPELYAPIAVKQVVKCPLNDAWRARTGKTYFIQHAKVEDILVGELAPTVTIETEEETGIIYAAMRGPGGFYASIPVLSDGNNRTKSFLCEASFVSRNIFPPFVWRENGTEYLYTSGFTYVEASSVPKLSEGHICTGEGDTCLVYRIEAGVQFTLSSTNARIILLDPTLHIIYDSLWGFPVQTVGEGYMILLSDRAETLDVGI